MSAREKVAYLKGLIEGSNFAGGDDKATTIWNAVLDVLDEVTEEIDALDMDQAELENYVDAIDDDLSYLESDYYEEDDEDDGTVELECPECDEVVCFDEDLLFEDVEVTCPYCGAVVYSSDDGDVDDEEEPEE